MSRLIRHSLSVSGRSPAAPLGIRIYAIGDIHGRLDLLDRLLAAIADDVRQRPTERVLHVFLGDYVDRGPCSRATIDRLIAFRGPSVFLKGNHEQIAVRSLTEPSAFERWMHIGGAETLVSYGISPDVSTTKGSNVVKMQAAFYEALSTQQLQFFRSLQLSFTSGDFFFVHAGVRPGVKLQQQKEDDLLWIRHDFLSSKDDFGKIIVHGHTPVETVNVTTNRINIDTGAFATGRLTCLVIEGSSIGIIDTR